MSRLVSLLSQFQLLMFPSQERETETGLSVLQLETTVGSLVSKIRDPLIIGRY
jgi:hypothetical protein